MLQQADGETTEQRGDDVGSLRGRRQYTTINNQAAATQFTINQWII